MQDRAYAIAHAVETNAEPRRLPPASQTAVCGAELSYDCNFPSLGSNRTLSPVDRDEQLNRPTEQTNPYESYPVAPPRADTPQAPRGLRADMSASETGETLLTSLPQGSLDPSGNSTNLRAREGSKEREESTASTSSEFAPSSQAAISQPESISGRRTNRNRAERRAARFRRR